MLKRPSCNLVSHVFLFLSLFDIDFPLELNNAEGAHKKALSELDQMRYQMVTMEQERLAMVAEVEAQIECALLSMQVELDEDDSDYESRPSSRLSSASGTHTPHTGGNRTPHRKHSDASRKGMRSYATDSTFVEYEEIIPVMYRPMNTVNVIEEEDEPPISPISPSKKKRFSFNATDEPGNNNNNHQDAMVAVDEGISEKSDRIAQKVLQIQKKVSRVPVLPLHNLTSSLA